MAVKQKVTVLQGDNDVTIFHVTETTNGVAAAKNLTGWDANVEVRPDAENETPTFAYDTTDLSPRLVCTDAEAGELTVMWNPTNIAIAGKFWHRLRIRNSVSAPVGRTVSYGDFQVIDT